MYGLADGDVDKVSNYGGYAESYVKDVMERGKKTWAGKRNNGGNLGRGSTLLSEAMVVLNLYKVWSSLAYCRGRHQPSLASYFIYYSNGYYEGPNDCKCF
mmetsp:Transcript_14738/g.20859  ORF Transcript_14738/g.20859 Transcript_14738/m.20859 type:complete len:100 (+) Transcript_14738:2244-2543(+)